LETGSGWLKAVYCPPLRQPENGLRHPTRVIRFRFAEALGFSFVETFGFSFAETRFTRFQAASGG